MDLAAVLRPMHPGKLVGAISRLNQQLFDQYITFPKPIFAAVNGPSIGAAVTSATLTDGILCNSRATFTTPFAALGLVPEGCSSLLFPRLFGPELSRKMLVDGHKLTAGEALRSGMVARVVESRTPEPWLPPGPDEALLEAAHEHAEAYVARHGRVRSRSPAQTQELLDVNKRESKALAEAFTSVAFLKAMEAQAQRKGRAAQAAAFAALRSARPLWARLLPN